MQRYSLFSLARHALTRHRHWRPAWRTPRLRERYEVIIIGAGGHGLAAAHYLAREHGITDVAVLERGWLGGGILARNTVTIRSNYLRDESIPFYVKSVSLFEGLTRELNINLMYSKRTMIDVVQTSPKLREIRRRMLNGALHGSTYEPISVEELRRRIPPLTGGGPGSVTEVTSINLKREAFEKWRTGYASAYAIILFVAVFGLASIYVKALNKVKER